MQQVTRIRPAGRREDLRAVTLADGRRFLLEAEQVTFLGLFPEAAVDEALERRLVNLDERIRAREAALTLLRYRLDDLRRDLAKAYSLIPGQHRLNLHAIYVIAKGKVD